MDALTNTFAISSAIVVVLCTWKMVNMVWVRPKKLEKLLKNQGLNGNKYKLWFGDMKEFIKVSKQSKSTHIDIDDGHGVLSRIGAFNLQSVQKHGSCFITWMAWNPRMTIMDPDLIKEVLTKMNEFQKTGSNPFLRLLGTGLASYEGDQWANHRRLLTPAFHVEKLKNMVPTFQLSCSEMIGKWDKLVSLNGSCELDISPYIYALTSDVISRTAFGSSFEEGIRIFDLLREQSKHVMAVMMSFYLPGTWFLPTKRNRRMKAIDKEVKLSVRRIIDNRLKVVKTGEGSNYQDLLGIMLEANVKKIEQHQKNTHGMTIDEVIEECRFFYLAGQETTSTLLVWTMILLSRHQDWQSRAREEVFSVLGDNDMHADKLNHLKVVTMIFYEVLRLYPPVVALSRMIEKDTTLGKYSLPHGLQIGLPVMLIHYDEQIWGSDAKKFNPERFSQGVAHATKYQGSYFPFGWGPRICLGQNFALLEAKATLAMILQKFSFEVSPSYVHAPNLVLTLQPKHGAHLIFHKL